MHIAIEIVLFAALIFLSASFWATAKSLGHLRETLANESELLLLLHFVGADKLLEEAIKIEPVLGSYAANIETWDRAHEYSLKTTRNYLSLGIAIALLVSWYLGLGYLAANFALFLLPAFYEIPAHAKNNNAHHIHSIMVNLIKWNQTDSSECLHYCKQTRPDLTNLFNVLFVSGLDMRAKGKGCSA